MRREQTTTDTLVAALRSHTMQSPRGLAIAIATLLVALGCADKARADDREAAKKACMGDYKKYCSGVFPGGGRVKQCLTENLAKLEPACREIVARNVGAGKAAQPN